jgi:hypothetical protein
MAWALGSGYPVAFALPGAAIITSAGGRRPAISLPAARTPFSTRAARTMAECGGDQPARGLLGGERDTLIAIPLFIFMGIMLQRSKIAEDLLVTMAQLFGPVPGGLGHFGGVRGRAAGGHHGHRRRDRGGDGPDLAARDAAQQLFANPLATGTIAASGHAGADHSAVHRADHPGRPAGLCHGPGRDRAGRRFTRK